MLVYVIFIDDVQVFYVLCVMMSSHAHHATLLIHALHITTYTDR